MQEKITSLFDMDSLRKEFDEVHASLKSMGVLISSEKRLVVYGLVIFITGLTIGLLW